MMDFTEANLRRFRAWIQDRGRVEGTAEVYAGHVRSCAQDPDGITGRLISGKLAPNTIRTNLAALRAWATFSKDDALARRIRDLRLPPARRIHHKKPLTIEDWRRVIKHVQTCPMPSEGMRHVILIMAMRGLRCGDVLRMRRHEIRRGLDTGKLVSEAKGRKRLQVDVTPIRAPLTALMAEMERANVDVVRHLLTTSTSPKAATRKVWRAARRTAAAVGIPEMSPHRYRHTFAQNYLRQLAGDPNAIVKLQRYMGWESMTTAARYVDDVSHEELDRIGAGLVRDLMANSDADSAASSA